MLPLNSEDGPHESPHQLDTAKHKDEMLLQVRLLGGNVQGPSKSHEEIETNGHVVCTRGECDFVPQQEVFAPPISQSPKAATN
jgi:hypothetical protein